MTDTSQSKLTRFQWRPIDLSTPGGEFATKHSDIMERLEPVPLGRKETQEFAEVVVVRFARY